MRLFLLQVDAQQEEMLTWQDRWYQNKKVQNVVSQSRMMGKVKANIKIKLKDPNEQDEESSKATAATEEGGASSKEPQKPTVEELPEMIGSMEEYATLVGKSVDEIEKEEEAESSEEEEDGEDDPLWGAILGKK